MQVSIIVPSFNGLVKLQKLLPSLERQSKLPKEVIIVLDGSQDGSLEWIECSFQKYSQLNLKIINQPNKGRSSAKAVGANASTAEILLFSDDDMVHPPQWIEYHVTAHAFADVVTGPVDPFRLEEGSLELFNYYSSLIAVWSANQAFAFTAANVSFKRDIYMLAGGFRIGLRDAEDREFAARLNNLGISIMYEPNCMTTTACYLNFREYASRLREYRIGNRFVSEMNSFKHKSLSVYLRSALQEIKHIAFIHNVMATLIDFSFFAYLPTSVRFNIYTRILF